MRASRVLLLAVLAGCGADADGDGFLATIDCDDADASVFPGATERCDGVDQDCGGDGDLGAVDAFVVWTDGDGDGAGDPALPRFVCALEAGDADAPSDCDDGDPARHPQAAETCNAVDDDCDGAIDDGATGTSTFLADADGDGFGDDAAAVTACAQPLGTATVGGDCDDHDGDTFPGAPEDCGPVDRDCDTDPSAGAADAASWYADADGDGFGDPADVVSECAAPVGRLADATDCDDLSAAAHPGADETCNGADDDCDATVDEAAIDASLWFLDADGDGFGGASGAVLACEAPPGTADDVTDCDDGDPLVSPGAVEACGNGVDDDCSGVPDDCGLPSSVRADEADVAMDGRDAKRAGASVSAGGDVDGDGLDDLAVGEDPDSGGTGEVWLAYGVPSSGDLDAVAILITANVNQALGQTLAIAGDLDADGYDDVLVGAPDQDGYDGGVHLRYGGPARWTAGGIAAFDARWDGVSAERLGHSVTGLGDIDGDGFDDAAFAGPIYNTQGYVYLVLGGAVRRAGNLSPSALPRVVGAAGDELGWGTAIDGGDLDGDGLSDVAMGTDHANGDGAVHLLYGDPVAPVGATLVATLPRIEETSPTAITFAWQVSVPGDLDGDGYEDLVASDVFESSLAFSGGEAWAFAGGAVRYAGVTPVSAAFLQVQGVDGYAYCGQGLAGADLDGDGADELAVGCAQVTGGLPGEVGIYAGRSGTVRSDDADLRIVGESGYSDFGSSISRGDLDGDGLPDLAIGAPGFGGDDGRAYVFLGSSW